MPEEVATAAGSAQAASELARELAGEVERLNRLSASLAVRITALQRETDGLVEQRERVRSRRGEVAAGLLKALTAAGVDETEAAGIVERALATDGGD